MLLLQGEKETLVGKKVEADCSELAAETMLKNVCVLKYVCPVFTAKSLRIFCTIASFHLELPPQFNSQMFQEDFWELCCMVFSFLYELRLCI